MNAENEMRLESAQARENELERKLESMTNELGEVKDDFRRYCELQSLMKVLRSALGMSAIDTPEYQSLWTESETIKNRHGGLPPKQL